MPDAASTPDTASDHGAAAMDDGPSINSYQREVLAVRAPVVVTLAHKSVPLAAVLDLVPGAMVQFDKDCDAPLRLEVGGHAIALGEAVKVDDKFGLRIRSFDVTEDSL